jgi:CheY-like chemotaxis protein
MGDTGRKKVLVADDEPSIRRLYELELRREGYDVLMAASGFETLRLVKDEKPDIVVLDIRMAGMDGIQTMDRILEENNEIPIILCTAYSKHRESFMSWAADAYLIKSSDLSELKTAIRTLIARTQ